MLGFAQSYSFTSKPPLGGPRVQWVTRALPWRFGTTSDGRFDHRIIPRRTLTVRGDRIQSGAKTALAEPSQEREIFRTLSRTMSGKQHFKLEGLVVAIVTPFQPCNLRVDEDSFVKYLQYLWDAGVRSIIVNGTTGEFTSMTMEERMHITELARAHWPGIMVNNVSAASYQDALALLEHSQQPIAGAEAKVDAALLLPPYYFSAAPEEGLERWLRHVLEEAHQPVFLYNFPAHTGNMIGPGLYARLAHDFPLLRGIKNTFDDVAMAQQFKYAMPDRQVFIGSDKMALEAAEAGLDGNVSSGGGSAIVSAMLATVDAAVKGDDKSAESAFASVASWHDQREGMGVLDIPAAKVALANTIEGFSATVRPPLLPASREQQQQLQDAMHRLNNSKS